MRIMLAASRGHRLTACASFVPRCCCCSTMQVPVCCLCVLHASALHPRWASTCPGYGRLTGMPVACRGRALRFTVACKLTCKPLLVLHKLVAALAARVLVHTVLLRNACVTLANGWMCFVLAEGAHQKALASSIMLEGHTAALTYLHQVVPKGSKFGRVAPWSHNCKWSCIFSDAIIGGKS